MKRHLPTVAVLLLATAALVAMVARDTRWNRWLRDNGCRLLPMQDADTTAGRATGERCYVCQEGRVTVCR